MTLERRFATAFRGVDDSAPGLILKDDGTVWLVNPNGSETQLPGGAGSPPLWSYLIGGVSISNGDVDGSNSYCLGLTQAADPDGAFPSLTAIWARIVYGSYSGGGEPGVLTISLDPSSAALSENHKDETCEIAGFWATGGIGSGGQAFGGSYWSSVDGTVNVSGDPVFSGAGDVLLCGMGIFPSF